MLDCIRRMRTQTQTQALPLTLTLGHPDHPGNHGDLA